MKGKVNYKIFPFLLAICLLVGTIFAAMQQSKQLHLDATNPSTSNSSKTDSGEANAKIVRTNTIPNTEMRAVWVPFMALDLKGKECNEETFKEKFDCIIEDSKKYGINTLIVHVRPFGDALYPSSIYPWSHLLTGTQGTDPGFDPMNYMIDATHNASMKFHAWINPLRIQTNETPGILSEVNPYNKWRKDTDPSNDEWVLDWGKDKYYNAAYPQVRQTIIDGIKEIVENYPVDGIHFDDYFYPTEDPSYDKVSYDEYCKSVANGANPLSQFEWRIANINALITGVYSAIKSADPAIQFGISPQANIENDKKMSADVESWASKKGYVDYLCPQLYVNFDHPILPYNKAVDQWNSLITCNEVKYYIGLGVYKAGSNADNGSWQSSSDILRKQIEYGRTAGCDGFMLYSWEYLSKDQTALEIANAMKVLK